MAAPSLVNVFIPYELLNKISHAYVLGFWEKSALSILVNCTTAIESKDNYKTFRQKLCHVLNAGSVGNNDKLHFLGLVYTSRRKKCIENDSSENNGDNLTFVIRIDEISESFHFETLSADRINSRLCGQVILYDGYGITKSKLLPVSEDRAFSASSDESFIFFLNQTNRNNVNYHVTLSNFGRQEDIKDIYFVNSNEPNTNILSSFIFFIVLILSKIHNVVSRILHWVPGVFINIILLTAVGKQFQQRLYHFANIITHLKMEELSLKTKNLISAIFLDVMCGCLVTYALQHSDLPLIMLDTAETQTNDIVNGLKNLIQWLMGVPAGLKLNIPLNNALGQFFLYHIYLWESYMMVVQPVFTFVLNISTMIGIFGLTFFLSLLSDLMSLATIHIYCFYGYAARLYGYQMSSLSALWRLFRGKKWNPLRQRIDSYTYDVHQLYLGTLIFTVLLFLLPTVMVYYFVFTCLRIVVLIFQGILSRIINILMVCPLYAVILRIFGAAETAGDVYFAVFNTKAAVTLTMEASQIPLKTVIKMSLPELNKSQEILTWGDFLSSIIWGKIVYPL